MRTLRCMLVCWCALAMFACDSNTPPDNRQKDDNNFKKINDPKTKVSQIAPQCGRKARRLSVRQLRATVERLFPELEWTGNNYQPGQQTTTNMFDLLGRTLGEPDYLTVTREDREPNPIFMKFMEDMARNLCARQLTLDPNKPESDRQFWKYLDEADIDKNLRFIRLKFHGIYVPETSTESITELRGLYDSIRSTTGQPTKAWLGVCIATLTAPEFYTY